MWYILLFPFEPIESLHSRPNGSVSVLSSVEAQLPAALLPEDNGQPPSEAAVTESDSKWRAQRRRHQMVKVNHLASNMAKTLTFRECSARSLEGGKKMQCIKGVFPFRAGRMQPQRTAWNACVLTVQPPPLDTRPNEYRSWCWSEVNVDHLGVGCQKACRL